MRDITVEELNEERWRGGTVPIDVRSPGEFADATIPGSLNIPLFDDGERAEVGTLYVQAGVEAAKRRGLEIVSAKLPAFVDQFARVPGDKTVFCWRGGMRSKVTATLLSLMDIRVRRLAGGYRAYRRWVVQFLETAEIRPRMVVLHGLTGTGKSWMLRRLAADGFPVLDLEAMAGHRGSIFGEVGLRANNQKTFDALLAEALVRWRNAPFLLMEAESRRIGKVVLPERLWAKKEEGLHLLVELPLEERVRLILQDYEPWNHHEACLAAFRRIKEAIHTPVAKEIESLLLRQAYAPAVELLLAFYYDPRYRHAGRHYDIRPEHVIRARHVEEACGRVRELLLGLGGAGR
jgi:tRNA 2-selenouridine synthase